VSSVVLALESDAGLAAGVLAGFEELLLLPQLLKKVREAAIKSEFKAMCLNFIRFDFFIKGELQNSTIYLVSMLKVINSRLSKILNDKNLFVVNRSALPEYPILSIFTRLQQLVG